MGNTIYGGVQTPFWYQIDKIHYGSANSLNLNLASGDDEIMLGRYVLVKYTELVLSQDSKNELIQGVGETNNLVLADEWKTCYHEDKRDFELKKDIEGNPFTDYDGVVFKKIYDTELKYVPIAQLSTSISADATASKAELEANYLKKTEAENTYLSQENASVQYISKEEATWLDEVKAFFENKGIQTEVIDTLTEIQEQFGEDATLIQNLEDAIETNATNIQTNTKNIDNLTGKIDNIGKMAVVDIDTVDPVGEKDSDGWLKADNSNLLLNTIYTKKIYKTSEELDLTKESSVTNLEISQIFSIVLNGQKGSLWGLRAYLRGIYDNNDDISNGYPAIPTFAADGGVTYSEAFPIFYGEIKENEKEVGKATLALYGDLKAICLYTTLSDKNQLVAKWSDVFNSSEIGDKITTSPIDLTTLYPSYSFVWKPAEIKELVETEAGELKEVKIYTLVNNYCTTNIYYQDITSQEIRYLTTSNGQNTWAFVGNAGVAPQWRMF